MSQVQILFYPYMHSRSQLFAVVFVNGLVRIYGIVENPVSIFCRSANRTFSTSRRNYFYRTSSHRQLKPRLPAWASEAWLCKSDRTKRIISIINLFRSMPFWQFFPRQRGPRVRFLYSRLPATFESRFVWLTLDRLMRNRGLLKLKRYGFVQRKLVYAIYSLYSRHLSSVGLVPIYKKSGLDIRRPKYKRGRTKFAPWYYMFEQFSGNREGLYRTTKFKYCYKNRIYFVRHWARSLAFDSKKKFAKIFRNSYRRARTKAPYLSNVANIIGARIFCRAAALNFVQSARDARHLIESRQLFVNGNLIQCFDNIAKVGDILSIEINSSGRAFRLLSHKALIRLCPFRKNYDFFNSTLIPRFLLNDTSFKSYSALFDVLACGFPVPSKLSVLRRENRASSYVSDYWRFMVYVTGFINYICYSLLLLKAKPPRNPRVVGLLKRRLFYCLLSAGLGLVRGPRGSRRSSYKIVYGVKLLFNFLFGGNRRAGFFRKRLRRFLHIEFYDTSSKYVSSVYRRVKKRGFYKNLIPQWPSYPSDISLLQFFSSQWLIKRYLFNKAFLLRRANNLYRNVWFNTLSAGLYVHSSVSLSSRIPAGTFFSNRISSQLYSINWSLKILNKVVPRWSPDEPWYTGHLVITPFHETRAHAGVRLIRLGLYARPMLYALWLRRRLAVPYLRRYHRYRVLSVPVKKGFQYLRGRFRWGSSNIFSLIFNTYHMGLSYGLTSWGTTPLPAQYPMGRKFFDTAKLTTGQILSRSMRKGARAEIASLAGKLVRQFFFRGARLRYGMLSTSIMHYHLVNRLQKFYRPSYLYSIIGSIIRGFYYGINQAKDAGDPVVPMYGNIVLSHRPIAHTMLRSLWIKRFRGIRDTRAYGLFSLLRRRAIGFSYDRRIRIRPTTVPFIRWRRDKNIVRRYEVQTVTLKDLFAVLASYMIWRCKFVMVNKIVRTLSNRNRCNAILYTVRVSLEEGRLVRISSFLSSCLVNRRFLASCSVKVINFLNNTFYLFISRHSGVIIDTTVGRQGFRKSQRSFPASVESSTQRMLEAVKSTYAEVPLALTYCGADRNFLSVSKGLINSDCPFVSFTVEDKIRFGGTRLSKRRRK